jgi:hypothetical protein
MNGGGHKVAGIMPMVPAFIPMSEISVQPCTTRTIVFCWGPLQICKDIRHILKLLYNCKSILCADIGELRTGEVRKPEGPLIGSPGETFPKAVIADVNESGNF